MNFGDIDMISPEIEKPKIVPRINPDDDFPTSLSSVAQFNADFPGLEEKVKKFCLKDPSSSSLKELFTSDQMR